jgi:hypothetical protein
LGGLYLNGPYTAKFLLNFKKVLFGGDQFIVCPENFRSFKKYPYEIGMTASVV